jgi:peptidoglycan/xylan/chitin deacetylase (PgdA/CDA1 family)
MAVLRAVRSRLKSTVLNVLPDTRVIRRGPTSHRRVALTFDDGPDEMTGQYLELLDRLAAPATFFLPGRRVEGRPEMIREYVRRGHQIAAHGYDHRRFPDLSWSELRDQLDRTDALIGVQPAGRPWVRPPFGAIDGRSLAQMMSLGYVVAMWSLDSGDWETRDADEVAARSLTATSGEIVLLHEGQAWTLAALPRIVRGLRDAGYELVTMADLFPR